MTKEWWSVEFWDDLAWRNDPSLVPGDGSWIPAPALYKDEENALLAYDRYVAEFPRVRLVRRQEEIITSTVDSAETA